MCQYKSHNVLVQSSQFFGFQSFYGLKLYYRGTTKFIVSYLKVFLGATNFYCCGTTYFKVPGKLIKFVHVVVKSSWLHVQKFQTNKNLLMQYKVYSFRLQSFQNYKPGCIFFFSSFLMYKNILNRILCFSLAQEDAKPLCECICTLENKNQSIFLFFKKKIIPPVRLSMKSQIIVPHF